MIDLPTAVEPRQQIEARLASRRAEAARGERLDRWIAFARLAAFAATVGLAWLGFGAHRLSAAWLLAPAAGYAALAALHERVLRGRERARRAVSHHEAALARLGGRWQGRGTPGDRFTSEDHPYAADLDVFGRGSLFERLCVARTYPGEERLASWLLAPSTPEELRARQGAVRALAPRLLLREDLAVLGEDVRAAVDAAALGRWGAAPPLLPGWLAPAAWVLAAASLAGGAAWALGGGPLLLAAAALASWGLARAARGEVARVLGAVTRPARELEVLSLLLARLEREPPAGDPRLVALLSAIAGPPRASARIARLARHVARLEWGKNQFFAPFAFLLQWGPLHAVAVERWRRANGAGLAAWLDAVADLEALSSLAGWSFERPDATFPDVVTAEGGGAWLEGEALRHPLLDPCVPNDVRLGAGGPRALLVSGSNMSGKSTYLRTVGANLVLALAGAPVPAARLRLSPVALGATLRIQDSLQAGRSRFYAEITRLKALHDLAAGPVPLLFLLDELLHGTNSHDRRVGAEAVLRALIGRGAAGIVTTHDLALTELAGTAPGAVANAHFEDQVRDGEIAFDYRLRPGVVAHSNALALMRAVGLEV
ncbi:MAG TPA: DNA mismatch repair protein MutS [Anaeromyxobacteraceae bacterium]|nr:DNA mismatch repair protein MutS [Anaeromyxobacteraceae bacterium]